jgi:CheY-like chemotaxis protein
MQALLMIKSDDAVGGFFKNALEEDGRYSVTLASSGDEGVALAYELSPAVVITDLVLPGLNGIAVAKAIKTDPQLAHIPIIILTRSPTESQAIALARQGTCDRYLTKPISVDKLRACVEELLEVGRV